MQSKKLRNWIVAGVALSAGFVGSAAQAQTAPAGAGTMELPKGVTRVISIDAHNFLLVESVDADGKKKYSIIQPRHVYSGGLARIFGGTVIPTEALVIPESANGAGFQGQGVRGGVTGVRGNQFQNQAPFAGTAPGGVIGGPFTGR